LLLLVSTHTTYLPYRLVERLVPAQIPSLFSAASEAGGTNSVWDTQ